MELVATEARALDFLESLGDDGAPVAGLGRRHFRLLARQVAGGVAITWRTAAGGELVAIAGVYPDPVQMNHAEAWFSAGPGLRGNLRAGLAAIAATLDAVGAEAAPVRVRALIGGVAGPRVAALLGFTAAGPIETASGRYESFERVYGPCPKS